ncbi:strawberry notch protein [Nymphaea thermarum]|nr:strawberry notch protein [Nymphaea thermarum]
MGTGLLFTNLGGERRFASIVAKRLETLGALTQGDRRAGPSLSAYNYDSNYGKKSLTMLYKAVMEQSDLPVMPPGCSPEKSDSIREYLMKAKAALVSVGIIRDSALGSGKDSGKITGRIVESDMNDVGRFLNRLLGLPPDIQNRLFEFFVSILDILVHDARKEGQFDSGIVDIKGNHIELKEPPKTVYMDPTSGASTVLFTFTIDRGITWEGANKLLDQNQESGLPCSSGGFYESRREWMGKRHFLLAFECSSAGSGMLKVFRPAVGEALREMPLEELQSKYRKVSSLEKAQKGWQEEYEISSKQCSAYYFASQCMHGPKCKHGRFCTVGRRLQEVSVLGGLILPVWGTIEKALTKQVHQRHTRLRVVRVETTEERQRVVGLLIPNAAVTSVLQGLDGEV